MESGTNWASKHRLEFDTTDVKLDSRTDYWHDKIEAFFDIEKPEILDEKTGFVGTMALLQTSRIIFGKVSSQQQTFVRDAKRLAVDGLDHFIVQVFTRGGGRVEDMASVSQGDLFVIDMAKLHRRASTSFSNLSFVIPRDFDPVLTRILEPLHNQAISGRHPLVDMIRRQMVQLWDIQDQLTKAQLEIVMENSVEMIKLTVQNLMPSLEVTTNEASPALAHAIRDYIEHNLDKPLSAEYLADRFHVSRSHLYRMFAHEEGVSRYVQERRLMNAYRLLLKSNHSQTSFGIAAACGFKSESHFSSAFKARFGKNAGDVRSEGNVLELSTDGDRELLDKWLIDL